MKAFLLLIVLVAGALGDELQPQPRIIDGKNASRNQFPYEVCIRHAKSEHHIAGGSIISRRWVLTATHYIRKYNAFDLRVVVGILKLSDQNVRNQQRRRVVKIVNHPKFSPVTYFNDISLLKLSADLFYAINVQPIALPGPFSNFSGLAGTISGWGERNASVTKYPDTLQYAIVRILNATQCRREISNVGKEQLAYYDPRINLCSVPPLKREKNGICYGDVGGPLAVYDFKSKQTYLAGVISWAVKTCGKPGNPSVYTKVGAYIPWIHDVILKS